MPVATYEEFDATCFACGRYTHFGHLALIPPLSLSVICVAPRVVY